MGNVTINTYKTNYKPGMKAIVKISLFLLIILHSTSGFPQCVSPTDCDGDGVLDNIDLDDDNDGILDVDEVVGNSSTSWGLVNPTTANGVIDNSGCLNGGDPIGYNISNPPSQGDSDGNIYFSKSAFGGLPKDGDFEMTFDVPVNIRIASNTAQFGVPDDGLNYLNSIDDDILNIIQNNSRIANTEIAKEVGLTPSAVLERLRKLERNGSIKGYHATLDVEQMGVPLLAFVNVKIKACNWNDQVSKRLSEITWVQEIHEIVGNDSYLLKVRVKDTAHLSQVLKTQISTIPDVVHTQTTIVLNSIKESSKLHLNLNIKTNKEVLA